MVAPRKKREKRKAKAAAVPADPHGPPTLTDLARGPLWNSVVGYGESLPEDIERSFSMDDPESLYHRFLDVAELCRVLWVLQLAERGSQSGRRPR